MINQEKETQVYTEDLVHFVRCSIELCALLESATAVAELAKRALVLLPQIYTGMHQLPSYAYSPEVDYLQEHVTEDMYERIRTRLATVLGEQDEFPALVSEYVDDIPSAGYISEYLADVYQHLANLVGVVKDMNELTIPLAVGRLKLMAREHWGRSLVAVLGGLHQLWLEEIDEEQEDEEDAE